MSEVQPTPAAQAPTEAPAQAPIVQGDGKIQTPQAQEPQPAPAAEPAKAQPAAQEPAANPPAEPEKVVVPEKYELKLSDGSHLPQSALGRIEAFAKAQKLSQQEAQDMVKMQEEDIAAFVQDRKDAWHKEIAADKEIGGDKLKENVALSTRVIERFATPEFKAELDKSGYGSHPQLVKMFVKIGKAMAEDTAIWPRSVPTGQKSLEDIFYPKKQEPA